MGVNYQYGYGVPVDKQKSLQWFLKAAENGNTESMRALGIIYESGIGVEKDLRKAFQYFADAVVAGNVRSLEKLAIFYEEGIVVAQNENKARELYNAYMIQLQKNALAGNADAMWRLGQTYQEGCELLNIPINLQQAVHWYEKASDLDYKEAQTSLGLLYAMGNGVPKNYKKAVQLYQKAAEQGDAAAMYNLAGCYKTGRGVEASDEQAAIYNQKAANMDMPEAQAELARMYYHGWGVEQDYTLAVHWYKRAIENGYANAYCGLACCYYNGFGVDKDHHEAFRLFELGEQQGDRHCLLAVAECCIEGLGTNKDFSRARNILENICEEHEDNQQKSRYATIEHENVQMEFWYNPLDEHMMPYYAKAYYLLGTLYYADKGCSRGDVSKAIAMLRMADRLGYHNDDAPEETAGKLINKIIETSAKEDISNSVDCYVEVREKKGLGERYIVVLHHADGSESEVNFKGRNKFLYILALLIAHEGQSVHGLTTSHFSYMRDDLASLAKKAQINIDSYKEWIDEFIYAEKPDNEGMRELKNYKEKYCSLDRHRYSNALSNANKAINECCISNEEYETFKLRSTGGKNAITTMSLDPEQIELPHSLAVYLDSLPTQEELASQYIEKAKWMPIKN